MYVLRASLRGLEAKAAAAWRMAVSWGERVKEMGILMDEVYEMVDEKVLIVCALDSSWG